jgi:hypothetical protein
LQNRAGRDGGRRLPPKPARQSALSRCGARRATEPGEAFAKPLEGKSKRMEGKSKLVEGKSKESPSAKLDFPMA